ncbi:MAG: DUF255 domain-containing protein [Bdellovibrionota bacterium]
MDWFPWGEEAFEKAKSTQKPILLSIGYSSCHWCHVMAHESFEDDETAELMNELFINIKVDREERPDVDEIYLQAVQMIAGHGGWPLTVFLTPELKPFFGGTYFPLNASYGQPSFKDVLVSVSTFFIKNKDEVYKKSEEILKLLKSFSHETSSIHFEQILQKKNLNIIAEKLMENYDDLLKILAAQTDKKYGGFGRAPKFPQPSKLSAFLFSNNEEYSKHAVFSLIQICCGGITDQIGGGISRYSVDEKWLVPHFEKMLYDNAQIMPLLAAASLKANKAQSSILKKYTYNVFNYLERDLKSVHTSLYFSSEDADSEGEEGLFYTFLHEEFVQIFSTNAELLKFAEKFYSITIHGNFEETNILTASTNLELFCEKFNLEINDAVKLQEAAKKELFNYREKRIRPGLDNKCILSWNALLATGILQTSTYLNDRNMFKSGLELVRNLLIEFKLNDKYTHCITEEKNEIPALADDVSFLLEACCEAFLLTGCSDLLKEIKLLFQYLDHNFCDHNAGLLYYSEDNKNLILRPVKNEDNVIYSANSAIVNSFIKLQSFQKMNVNDSFFTADEFKLFENISTIAFANSAVLANKVPISSAKLLQIVKYLSSEKFLFIDNQKERTDFEPIANVINKFCTTQDGYLFVGCSLNNSFTLNNISSYAHIIKNKNTKYLYCDKTGCQLAARTVSEISFTP